jgi:hypothetical protein
LLGYQAVLDEFADQLGNEGSADVEVVGKLLTPMFRVLADLVLAENSSG